MADKTQSYSASVTEPSDNYSRMPNAVSVSYPYSRTPDGEGSGHLSVVMGNSEEIDSFCEQRSLFPDSYIRAALICALLRILRQDGLALTAGLPGTTLACSMQWLDLQAVEVIERTDRQFRAGLQSAEAKVVAHFTHNSCEVSSICEDTSEGDIIRFFSGKTDDGSYALSLTYNAGLYSGGDMQALLDAWFMLVTEFCRQDCPVKLLPIVTPLERERLLEMGDGDIRNPYGPGDDGFLPENVTILDRFIRIAHESPDRTVVIDADGSYTCGQLNS